MFVNKLHLQRNINGAAIVSRKFYSHTRLKTDNRFPLNLRICTRTLKYFLRDWYMYSRDNETLLLFV